MSNSFLEEIPYSLMVKKLMNYMIIPNTKEETQAICPANFSNSVCSL